MSVSRVSLRSFLGAFLSCLAVMAFVVEASLEKTYNVSRFAGTGSTGNPNGDWGPAVDAHFQYPNAVWFDTVRNLYISDTSNGRIRVVSGNKIISTFAGTSAGAVAGNNGPVTSAGLSVVSGVCGDNSGVIFITSSGSGQLVRKVDLTSGIITAYIGTSGASSSSGDGGQATSATITPPNTCTVDTAGNLYVALAQEFTIRTVKASTTIISRYVGTGFAAVGSTGENGPATSATTQSQSIFMDTASNLFVADTGRARIKKVTPGGMISVFAGSGSTTFSGNLGRATSAGIPSGASILQVSGDVLGNVFMAVSSRIHRVDVDTTNIAVIAGNGSGNAGTTGFTGDGGFGTLATFTTILQLAVFGGDVCFPDQSNSVIRVLTENPVVTIAPSAVPTDSPSTVPSAVPTLSPSMTPTVSHVPSTLPSVTPSLSPSVAPSAVPSKAPTQSPSVAPTMTPSHEPSALPSVTPSLSPSAAPSCAPTPRPTISVSPSMAPTMTPSHEPSALPSVTPSLSPSAAPSCAPTPRPTITVKPSPAFTFMPSPPLTAPPTASFNGIAVDQPVVIKYVRKGAVVDAAAMTVQSRLLLNVDQLDGNSKNALSSAVAEVLGLHWSAVTIVSEYLVDTNSTTGLSRVGVVFRCLVQDSDFPQQNFASPRALFTAVADLFAKSISEGSFNTAVALQASIYHAAELLGNDAQYDTSEPLTQPTYTEVDTYDPMDAGLSTGEYAGIVIGVLVAFMLLIGCVWFAAKRRDEDSRQQQQQSHSAVSINEV